MNEEIKKLIHDFTAWRNQRTHVRAHIPTKLWQRVIALDKQYPDNDIPAKCGIDKKRWKIKVGGRPSGITPKPLLKNSKVSSLLELPQLLVPENKKGDCPKFSVELVLSSGTVVRVC